MINQTPNEASMLMELPRRKLFSKANDLIGIEIEGPQAMCDHILFVFSVSKTDSNIYVGLQLFELEICV